MTKRVTIQDIADSLGITKGLVSRALTGKYNVSDQMREQITEKAVELDYDFSKLRSKSKKRSKCLLVMSSELFLNKDYWQPIIRSLTTTLDAHRINLEYLVYDVKSISADDIVKLKSAYASGYVFINDNPEPLLRAAERTNLPVVVIDPKTILSGKHLQIKYNNFYSFYQLACKLIQGGHKNFLFYGPAHESVSFAEREQGLAAAVAENHEIGAKLKRVLFDNAAGTYCDEEKLRAALAEYPATTAVFCANDIVAIQAVKTLAKMGKKVPDDVSVVGFDNIFESGLPQYSLTTVNVPRAELGEEAATYLVNHITNKQIKYSQIVIDCEIVIRNSVKNINSEEKVL